MSIPKKPAEPITTEDLETALRVLQSIAGTEDRLPYLPRVAEASRSLVLEIDTVLEFRKVKYDPSTDVILSFTREDRGLMERLIMTKNIGPGRRLG